jgi:hypothetical protein
VEAVRLRPHSHLLWRGIGGCLAFIIPTFGVLYILTVPDGPWPALIVANVVALAVVAAYVVSLNRVAIWAGPEGIAERGILPMVRRYPTEQIDSLVFVNIFHGGWVDTVPQLFVCDRNGKQIMRMRGQFWSSESMLRVAAAIDRPLTEVDHPVSATELLAMYPGLLYWFERRPVLAAACFAGALLLAGFGLYLILLSMGFARR